MLVVVAIVGLLSSVVVIGVGGAREKARDAKRIADLRQVQTYLEANYSGGAYPALSPWPSSLPKDPSSDNAYAYCTSGETYTIGATLENAANKPSGAANTATCTITGVTCNSTTGYCVIP